MKHLYTLTGNLLAEITTTYDAVEWGRPHRAVEESFQVGGKGINVAKMAQRLGLFSTAVFFPGGSTGERCLRWLQAQSFAVAPFPQVAETRSGWVVRAAGLETTFLGRDRAIEEDCWLAAIDFLAQNLKAGDVLAICGSFPGWRPALADPLERLLRQISENVFVAVDTYGAPLGELIRYPVDLVKVNREEFRTLLPPGEHGGIAEELRLMARKHAVVRQWVVTDGGGPVAASADDGSITLVDPPAVEVVSAVGCGDVLLAGLLHAVVDDQLALNEALKRALPLAAANAGSPGIADFKIG